MVLRVYIENIYPDAVSYGENRYTINANKRI